MMLAVDGRPLLGYHARGQPQPETEKVADDGVEVQRAMRLAAMQINRHRRNRDVGKYQHNQYIAPPR